MFVRVAELMISPQLVKAVAKEENRPTIGYFAHVNIVFFCAELKKEITFIVFFFPLPRRCFVGISFNNQKSETRS